MATPLCNVIILTEPFTTTLFHLPLLPPPEPCRRRMWPFKCCAETINWIVISAFRVLSYALLLPGPLNSGYHSFSTLLEHSVHSTLQEMHHPLLLLLLRFEIGNSCCTSTGLGAKLRNRKSGDKIRDSECVFQGGSEEIISSRLHSEFPPPPPLFERPNLSERKKFRFVYQTSLMRFFVAQERQPNGRGKAGG